MMNPNSKTIALFAVLTALLGVVGFLLGGGRGMVFFLLIAAFMDIGMYWFSDRIALSMARALPLSINEGPNIYQDVKELCAKMGLPTPRIYYTTDLQPNAFATGRDPAHSVICVTQGLVTSLSRDEVRAVLAHELAHIKNRDVLLATIAAVISGVISSLASFAFWNNSDDSEQNPLSAILMIFIAPVVATLLQLAISRAREFAADSTAASVMGNGESLANALRKISATAEDYPIPANPALASLYIANPLGSIALSKWFSTHPPVEERIARLINQAG